MSEPEALPPPAHPPPPAAVLPAIAKFERGDFRGATLAARALAASVDPEVEAAARALLARMAPDPWAIRAGLLALALLGLVTAIFGR